MRWCDRLMDDPALDRRRSQTLRSILELAIQVVGGLLILLVIFGCRARRQRSLALPTAALTIALQDFIIAFLGWFVLIGKNGIHVGDWVEINGVGGEVIDVRSVQYDAARDRDTCGQGTTDRAAHYLHERVCHSRPVLQLLHERAVDVG